MEPARPRAGLDRDEGVPAPTSGVFNFPVCAPKAGFLGEIKENSNFFEMPSFKIFRKE
jgi:hypothetical protein